MPDSLLVMMRAKGGLFTACALAAGAFGAVACVPPPAPDPSQPLVVPPAPNVGYNQGETAAAVMPPGANGSCSSGKTFIGFGDGWTEALMEAPNTCVHSFGCFSVVSPPPLPAGTIDMATTSALYPTPGVVDCKLATTTCDPTVPGDCPPRYQYIYTDMGLRRTSLATSTGPGSSLLHVALQQSLAPPDEPINVGRPPGCAADTCYSCAAPFFTNALFVQISDDCGGTWRNQAIFDINDPAFLGGRLAVAPTNANLGAGFDRQEVYVDPFARADGSTPAYVTASFFERSFGAANFLFRSLDGGSTWEDPLTWDFTASTVMTSTDSGRWFGLTCFQGEPYVLWLDRDSRTLFTAPDYGNTDTGPISISDGVKCVTAPDATLLDRPRNIGGYVAISRMSQVPTFPDYDCVRIAFPSLDASGSQTIELRQVCVRKEGIPFTPGHPLVLSQKMETLTDPAGGHLIQASFVETDRFEFKPGTVGADDAILHYYRWPKAMSTNLADLAYSTCRNGTCSSSQNQLSAGGWAPNLPLLDKPSTNFMGDYTHGAFFYQNGLANFLVPWAQTDGILGQPTNVMIHANTVSYAP